MELDNIHQDYRQTVLEHDRMSKEIEELKRANMVLTAELADRAEQIHIYKEMAHGVLFKSVDRYLHTLSNHNETSG